MELLAPAGDAAAALAALNSGADAVYLGLNEFSARESAENFDFMQLRTTVRLAHLYGAKVYLCLNTLVKDSETQRFFRTARLAWDAGVDAILIQDLFLGKRLKELYPEMTLHLSTQAGTCNLYGACLAAEYGFSRVVLARETPLQDIRAISSVIETEAFVQGALCSCFSGQCYLSSFAGNNSGNRGRCKQPCRKKYTIDRKGYERPAYALSLSDLRVGERVKELIGAGVSSLKIEGRMRRPEYVAAAVSYYRALLDGEDAARAQSALARTFNRGDYTQGLAFGQKGDLLSRDVQGHIGERVGRLELRGGRYFCRGRAGRGDGFKILRDRAEVGGAVCTEAGEDGFFLVSRDPLRAGDEVRITTDLALAKELLSARRGRKIVLSASFMPGELPVVRCGAWSFAGEAPLARAERAPLTRAEIETCFCRTDGLPFSVQFSEVVTQGAFLPRAALNAFRRAAYASLCDALDPPRTPLPERQPEEPEIAPSAPLPCAYITGEPTQDGEGICIYKPDDYTALPDRLPARCYLYLPAFFPQADIAAVLPHLSRFEGIYCEGYYGVMLARACGVALFAGTGMNLCNRFAAAGVIAAGAKYYALSKEISSREQQAIGGAGAYVLAAGAVKVMDLCYCPFERTCTRCDRRKVYTLRDEAGRCFPLRRYQTAGGCRFEVYNCDQLDCTAGDLGVLRDESVPALSGRVSRGHSERSML